MLVKDQKRVLFCQPTYFTKNVQRKYGKSLQLTLPVYTPKQAAEWTVLVLGPNYRLKTQRIFKQWPIFSARISSFFNSVKWSFSKMIAHRGFFFKTQWNDRSFYWNMTVPLSAQIWDKNVPILRHFLNHFPNGISILVLQKWHNLVSDLSAYQDWRLQ